MNVYVTQFLYPDGEQRELSVEIADDLAPQYVMIKECRCRLTAEVLSTNEVSQCIEHYEGDYSIEISTKEDAIPALERMIRAFSRDGLHLWLSEVQS